MDVVSAAPAAKGDYIEMKHFTIDAENNITAHASRKEAKESGLPVFGTEEQLADTIGNDSKRLVEIWNSLPGVVPVKKFANRKIATERIWKAIQGLGGPAAPGAEEAPSDSNGTPDAVASEHQSAIESAAAHVEAPASSIADEQLASAGAQAPDVAPGKAKATRKATAAKNAPKGKKAAKGEEAAGPREGSKTAQVVAMLQRKGGATLIEIMEKFGWQRHTVRGFMAGAMKKAGYTVESFKNATDERTYRINK